MFNNQDKMLKTTTTSDVTDTQHPFITPCQFEVREIHHGITLVYFVFSNCFATQYHNVNYAVNKSETYFGIIFKTNYIRLTINSQSDGVSYIYALYRSAPFFTGQCGEVTRKISFLDFL